MDQAAAAYAGISFFEQATTRPTVRIHGSAPARGVIGLCAAILDLQNRLADADTELDMHRLEREQEQLIRALTKLRGRLKTASEAKAVAITALALTDKDDLSTVIVNRLEGMYFKLAQFVIDDA